MAILLEFVRNSLWHAFSTLTDPEGGYTPKSRLKVKLYSFDFSWIFVIEVEFCHANIDN
jgi:hypothetical protein